MEIDAIRHGSIISAELKRRRAEKDFAITVAAANTKFELPQYVRRRQTEISITSFENLVIYFQLHTIFHLVWGEKASVSNPSLSCISLG